MSDFRIISLDGGGIRGLVSLALLDNIKEGFPQVIESSDMIAGTSTGGIIALCLASGMSTDTIIEMYLSKAEKIFKRNWLHFLGLTGSKYHNRGLKKIVNEMFGDLRMGDLEKRVLISSFDLMSEDIPKRWKPKFFHNFGDNKDDSIRVADVAMYTSAAPTFFPAVDGYIDGGMIANNPSMAALCQVLDERYGERINHEDVALLSLGTGESYCHIDNNEHNFGKLSVGQIVNILLSGTEAVPHYQCGTILRNRYIRINPVDAENLQLDDIDRMDEMLELGRREPVDHIVRWLVKNW